MDELIDKIEIKLEHILESDPRTMKNPECECGSIYDSVYEVLKMVRELEKYERVVRCKDCKYRGVKYESGNLSCKKLPLGYAHNPDWFCACGRKKNV